MKIGGLKANFIFNVAGPVLSLIVALITTPIYVSEIGLARFGLLVITWKFLGYFGFLDLGLSRASANALAKLRDPSLRVERAKVLSTAFPLNLSLGVVGGILFYFTGMLLIEHLITVPADLRPEIESSFPWVACGLPLGLIAGLGCGALDARERFLAANALGVAGSTVGLVVPVLCAILISPSLSVVIPATVIMRGLLVFVTLSLALQDELPLSPRHLDWKRCKTLLNYGGWISVFTILGQLLSTVDQLIIGAVLSVSAVAFYSVPMSFAVRSQLLAAALSRTLFPRMSRSARDEAHGITEKALVTLAYAYGAICAPAVVLTQPFLTLWMGEDFGSIAGPIGELLLIGAWINGLSFVFVALLEGQGRPDVFAKIDSFLLFPYIILVWFLTRHFGQLGAAASWNLLVAIEAGLVFVTVRLRPASLVRLLPPFGVILAAYLYVANWPPAMFSALLGAGIAAASICAGAIMFDPYAREFVTSLRFLGSSQDAASKELITKTIEMHPELE